VAKWKNGETLDIHYFFSGGFLLPYIFLAYTLDISVAEGKYGRYRSCPYLLLRRYEFVRDPELAVRK